MYQRGVGLNNLDDFRGDVSVGVVRDGDSEVSVLIHGHRGLDGLQQGAGIDTGQDKASLVERFGPFGRGTDADCRKRMSYTGEERTLFGQCSRIRDNGCCVHLQTVVVVETERFMADDPFVQHETALFDPFSTSRMA